MKPQKKKAAIRTLVITILGIGMGFVGELMPDGLKVGVENFALRTIGISYLALWISGVLLLMVIILIFVWKEGISAGETEGGPPNTLGRTVTQTGDKSLYIEKHKGQIKIK